ncbi:hypothetical protein GALL_491010 [mine drainage metagenome]|uniref:Uncharacterized protein n=1 Tax=mine drainage metagenome TaxID=410659 RepID=A0A1J5PP02_9ZZZZ
MDQAILMHAKIDEGTERGDVGHRAFELHAGLELGDVVHAVEELGGAELRARIASGLFQFGKHVAHGEIAEAVIDELLRQEAAQGIAIAHQRIDGLAGGLQHALDQRVAFGVHAGAVEWVVAAVDAQESSRLLEGFVAQPSHRFERFAVGERVDLVTLQHDLLGDASAQASHPRQQRRRGGVEIDADAVDAVLHDGIELARQRSLVDVMLILADADALGVDLHQFGQRVLHPAGDGHRPAQAHVQIGKFPAGQGACGIHRSPGFAHCQFVQAGVVRHAQQFGGELVGLAAGSAVADGNELHAVPPYQRGQGGERSLHVAARLEGIDGCGVEQLAGGIDHRHLHPGADSGVETHDHLGSGRCGQQQVAEIRAEHVDGHGLGLLAQPRQQFALQGERELDLPGPLHHPAQPVVCGAAPVRPAEQHGKSPFG